WSSLKRSSTSILVSRACPTRLIEETKNPSAHPEALFHANSRGSGSFCPGMVVGSLLLRCTFTTSSLRSPPSSILAWRRGRSALISSGLLVDGSAVTSWYRGGGE